MRRSAGFCKPAREAAGRPVHRGSFVPDRGDRRRPGWFQEGRSPRAMAGIQEGTGFRDAALGES
jgi:hypothetical protein